MYRGLSGLVSVLLPLSAALAACSARAPGNNSGYLGTHGGGSGGALNGGGGMGTTGADGPGPITIGGNTDVPVGVAKMLAFDPPTLTLVIDDPAAVQTAEFMLVA